MPFTNGLQKHLISVSDNKKRRNSLCDAIFLIALPSSVSHLQVREVVDTVFVRYFIWSPLQLIKVCSFSLQIQRVSKHGAWWALWVCCGDSRWQLLEPPGPSKPVCHASSPLTTCPTSCLLIYMVPWFLWRLLEPPRPYKPVSHLHSWLLSPLLVADLYGSLVSLQFLILGCLLRWWQ